jgi:malonate-semialdehyde dehydrogenase (acetylating)/methylmalonate-semialdehyde dehydrogenase
VGVVVSIVPFNFPFMVPFWTLPIALAMGNVVVIKPSEKVPLTMMKAMDIFREAGLPDGVVNLVNGTRETVEFLVDSPSVKAVTFVGTSAVARSLAHRARLLVCSLPSHQDKRVIALGGAKNHLVAARDCNIEMTSSDVVASFSGCSGQRCMAASVLLLIGEQTELVDAIVKKAECILPGDGSREMGPVIDCASRDRIIAYIDEAEAGGAKILLDGRKWGKKEGWWVGPTVIMHGKRDKAMKDEIFGPVLSVFVVASKDEAVEIENESEYGNAACIYTQDGGVAEWFVKRFSAGMCGVNIGVPVPREPFSFGGLWFCL